MLTRRAARALGLPEGLPVAGGGGDNAASAVGIGAMQPGDGFLSLGTCGVLFVVTDRYRPNPASAVHAFCHAVPGRWHQMSVMLSAASGLHWVTRLTGERDEAALLARVEALADAARDRAPLFLPYLSGERTPHDDPHASGVFFGMDNETDAARLGHAVIEGVAFGLADGLQALARRRHAGRPPRAGGRRRAQRALGAAARRRARTSSCRPWTAPRPAARWAPAASPGWRSATTSATFAARPRRAPCSSREPRAAPRSQRAWPLPRAVPPDPRPDAARLIPPSRRPRMTEYFAGIDKIRYAGPQATEPLAFKLVRQGSRGAGQAHGGAPALRRLLLALLQLARLRYFRRGTFDRPWLRVGRPDGGGQGQARRRLRVLRQARRAVLLLPRPRRRRRGRDARRERDNFRSIVDRMGEKQAADGREAAVGHGQPVQPPALHERRRDQPGPGGLRAGPRCRSRRRWRRPTASAARTTCCGAAARATSRC